MSAHIDISIVVPIYNEEKSLPILHEEMSAALAALPPRPDGAPMRAEVLYVDDCSTDASLLRLRQLWRDDPRVVVIKLRRNFGQTSALAAGFERTRGDVVITLDGDLQNDPADIPRLVAELNRGYDVVAGWRKNRFDGFFLRRIPSRVANRLIRLVTGVRIHDTGCTLKAFRRDLVKNMSIYAEQHRFLPVLSTGRGARISELVVNHRPRRFGQSKYGIGRATRVLLDLLSVKLISQFSSRPLQYFGLLSLFFLGVVLVFGTIGLFGFGAGESYMAGGPDRTWVFNEWEFMIVTMLVLVFSLHVYFGLLGLLGELAVKASGMHRRSTLDRILNELH
jgi:glycosyltransferase involved in cell wall biosynthesis